MTPEEQMKSLAEAKVVAERVLRRMPISELFQLIGAEGGGGTALTGQVKQLLQGGGMLTIIISEVTEVVKNRDSALALIAGAEEQRKRASLDLIALAEVTVQKNTKIKQLEQKVYKLQHGQDAAVQKATQPLRKHIDEQNHRLAEALLRAGKAEAACQHSHDVILLGVDGDQFTATFGDFINLQESPAGFGVTRTKAVEDLLFCAGMEHPDGNQKADEGEEAIEVRGADSTLDVDSAPAPTSLPGGNPDHGQADGQG